MPNSTSRRSYLSSIMTTLKSDMHPILNDEVLSRLRSKRILTVFDVIMEKPEKLSRCTGLPYKDVLSIRKILSGRFGGECQKISKQLRVRKERVISTGIPCLDILLDSGLFSGQIYEVCGASASGKTQLCLTLAVNIAMNNRAAVYYIDTKGDFSASRIVGMLEASKLRKEDTDRTMNSIRVLPVRTVGQLLKALNYFLKKPDHSAIELPPQRIIIVDSLPAVLFKFTNDNRVNYSLNNLANLCRCVANQSNASVLTVNLLTRQNLFRQFDPRRLRGDDIGAVRPALGKYWLHIPNTRLLIEKTGEECTSITVWKSFQSKVNAACSVRLTSAGVTPVA